MTTEDTNRPNERIHMEDSRETVDTVSQDVLIGGQISKKRMYRSSSLDDVPFCTVSG
jgi:hypothetical protein